MADSNNITVVTDENFQSEIAGNDGLSMVDFWATWCGPCRDALPDLSALAGRGKGHIIVLSVNLDGAGRATSGPAAEVLTRAALESLYGCRLREFVDGEARYLVPEI